MESYFSISLVYSEVVSIVDVGVFCDTSYEESDECDDLMLFTCFEVL